jgi:hypothetical protein
LPADILVAGTGPVADALLQGLRRSRRALDRLSALDPSDRRVRKARVLLLADEAARAVCQPGHLPALSAGRSPREPLLRVILAAAETPAPRLPGLPRAAGMTFETLDLAQVFARDLFARRPVHGGMDPRFGQVPHLLFAGTAPPAGALTIQAMRLAHYGGTPAVFTFACEDPEAFRDSLLARYPQADQACRLRFTTIAAPDLEGQPPVTGVYVCRGRPDDGLDTAVGLGRAIEGIQGVSPQIHLEVGDIRPEGPLADWDGQLFPFSWLREACRPEIWLEGRDDELAQVIHGHYRDSIASQGRDPSTEPAGRPWDELSASYRDASRYQADHLWAKLAITDCRAVPEEQVESFSFAPLEVERLAQVEHARWAADRYLDGWTFAVERDNARKHHPQLVPYADLSEPMKDLDRFAVRLLPVLLARSGRGILRMLIIGVACDVRGKDQPEGDVDRLAELVFGRLARRYPDRSLVLASTLTDVPSRLLVRKGLERFEAALFLLCERPIGELIDAQPSPEARRDLLDLVVRAERRICLEPGRAAHDWFTRRAELIVLADPAAAPSRPAKRVVLTAGAATPIWSFEY